MAEDNESREVGIKAYAEALADPTPKLFVELCKEKIEEEQNKQEKELGKQKVLIKSMQSQYFK